MKRKILISILGIFAGIGSALAITTCVCENGSDPIVVIKGGKVVISCPGSTVKCSTIEAPVPN